MISIACPDYGADNKRNIEKNGIIVFSLDFEMMWGVHDSKNSTYHPNITAVNEIVPRLLKIFKKYQFHCTWATVGALLSNSLDELIKSLPSKAPNYNNPRVSAYNYLDKIEAESKMHFAPRLIQKIAAEPNQELGSHSYMHYYCGELGQTVKDFEADIQAYNAILEKEKMKTISFVFPRNQYSAEYLDKLREYGFLCFRGLEESWLNGIKNKKIQRYLLFLDSYLNFSGDTTYFQDEISDKNMQILNIKSSYFYRPYSNNKLLEWLKTKRVKKQIERAAIKGKIIHIWCHPHNFGGNVEKSLSQLEDLLCFYSKMREKYGMKSLNMGELAKMILK